MPVCNYWILEYARSEEVLTGINFLIIVRDREQSRETVRACLLDDWVSITGIVEVYEIDYIKDFLFDVRQQSHREKHLVDYFFRTVESFSTGPLRTARSGVCPMQSPGVLNDALTGKSEIATFSQTAFNAAMVETLAAHPA